MLIFGYKVRRRICHGRPNCNATNLVPWLPCGLPWGRGWRLTKQKVSGPQLLGSKNNMASGKRHLAEGMTEVPKSVSYLRVSVRLNILSNLFFLKVQYVGGYGSEFDEQEVSLNER